MKVAFFDIKPNEKEYFEKNLDSSFEPFYFSHSLTCSTEITDEIKNAEIISCFIDSIISKKVLDKFLNLKFIILRSVGYSHVDLLCAKDKGIAVFNAPHYGDYSISEYVFALLFSVSRKIIKASDDVKKQQIIDTKYQGVEFFNKTMGIIGLGAIGKKVAEVANALSLKTLCYDIKKQDGYNFVSLDELCEKSDIISINCPLTSETLHMFDENRFNGLKDGVILINTARGEIIKTEALYKALLSKKVSYFAADVVECENVFYEDRENKIDIQTIKENCLKNFYITRKLLTMENVLITPHIAYNTKEAQKRILEITIDNLIASTKFTNSAKNLVLI